MAPWFYIVFESNTQYLSEALGCPYNRFILNLNALVWESIVEALKGHLGPWPHGMLERLPN